MKFFALVFGLILLLNGCAKNKLQTVGPESKQPKVAQTSSSTKKTTEKEPVAKNVKADSRPVITPDESPSGKVVSVNRNARFAVINFPNGNVPPTGRRLSVYHNDLKVGELQVTGPQQDDNTVANIIAGEAQVKDDVRED